MKKIFFAFVFSTLTLGISLTSGSQVLAQEEAKPTEQPQQQAINSFDMFWPIVAGRTMGDSLYFLKTLKENLRETIMFSNFKKADYNITLSVKRLVESEKLLVEKKDVANAKKSLDAAQQKREKALEFINKAAGEGRYVTDLKTTLSNSLEKQRALQNYLVTKVDDEGKKILEENVSKLNEVLAKVQG